MISGWTARWTVAAGLASLGIALPAHGSPQDWDRASSVVRTGIVAFSIGLPAKKNDWSGLRQNALALGATGAITGGLKRVSHEQRPDVSDDRSFPSGHTSISFAAAAGLEQRYGWKLGLPAHMAAAFVGIARVKAKKHYLHDVLIGAAIGEAAGLLLVRKHRPNQNAPIVAGFSVVF
jgi:membrane-associated phospholipid phosphatase